jgi:hypothetical protein
MRRLILLVALVMAMAVLAPVAFADDLEEADVETEEKDPSAAQELKADMIAAYFTTLSKQDGPVVTGDYVTSLRMGDDVGHTVGWGVVYKLMFYDEAGVKSAKNGDGDGWGIGHLRKTYLENPDNSEMPKSSLGQLHREEKSAKPDKTMPDQAGKKDKTDR